MENAIYCGLRSGSVYRFSTLLQAKAFCYDDIEMLFCVFVFGRKTSTGELDIPMVGFVVSVPSRALQSFVRTQETHQSICRNLCSAT